MASKAPIRMATAGAVTGVKASLTLMGDSIFLKLP